MPAPITIHNLPVAPREVQVVFDTVNEWQATLADGEEVERVSPTEIDFCAIVYDSGPAPDTTLQKRDIIIEATEEGYSYTLYAVFTGDDLQSLTINGDDDDYTRLVYPFKEAIRSADALYQLWRESRPDLFT